MATMRTLYSIGVALTALRWCAVAENTDKVRVRIVRIARLSGRKRLEMRLRCARRQRRYAALLLEEQYDSSLALLTCFALFRHIFLSLFLMQTHHVRRNAAMPPFECMPLMTHVLYEPDAINPGPDHEWGCQLLDESEALLKLDGLDNLAPNIKAEMVSGKTTLIIPGAQVTDRSITIPKDSKCKLNKNPPTMSAKADNVFQEGTRNLQSAAKKVLVVRVTSGSRAPTVSKEVLSNRTFGTGGDDFTLVSQFAACSFGQLTFEPLTGVGGLPSDKTAANAGVTEVNVEWTTNARLLDDRVINALNSTFKNSYDHVMLCLPGGAQFGGQEAWIAYATLTGKLTVFNDRGGWCTSASAHMHELGHNYNLDHSGVPYVPNISEVPQFQYEDKTGYMGFGSSRTDGPKKCFNAAKSWELDWYKSKAVAVSPLTESLWTGKLYGIVDYGNGAANVVLVKIVEPGKVPDYYMNFNRKDGFNSETEHGDTVRIVRDPVALSADSSYSEAVATLTPGNQDTYEIDNFGGSGKKVRITVNDIVSSSANPWYADVTIAKSCAQKSDCPEGPGSCALVCDAGFCTCPFVSDDLLTTLSSNNGSNGNMFEVVAKAEDIQITKFDIHVSSGTDVLVYTKVKGFSGAEKNKAAWELVPLQSKTVSPLGTGKLTPLPLADSIGIPAGSTRSFYITMTSSGGLRYTNGSTRDNVYREDSYIQILEGVGVSFEFGSTFSPRVWNGRIYYIVAPVSSSPPPPGPTPLACSDSKDCDSFVFACRYSCQGGLCQPNAGTTCDCDESCNAFKSENIYTCPSDCIQTREQLTTKVTGGNGSWGNQFSVKAINAIQITSFDVHLDDFSGNTKVPVRVYTKVGTYVGHERNPASWTLIQSAEVESQGLGQLTSLPVLSNPIVILPSVTQSFYVTLIETGLKYTSGVEEGRLLLPESENLQFFEGKGISGLFGIISLHSPRVWNGRINYLVDPSFITTMAGGTGQAGNFFELEAKNEIRILGFDIHADLLGTAYTVQVYKRDGPLSDFDNSAGSWNLQPLQGGGGVVSHGLDALTPVPPLSNPILLSPRDGKVSFYVKLNDKNLKYSRGTEEGRVFKEDANLFFYEGRGVANQIGSDAGFGTNWSPRIFNGKVRYEVV